MYSFFLSFFRSVFVSSLHQLNQFTTRKLVSYMFGLVVFQCELIVPFSQICGFDNNVFIYIFAGANVCSKFVFQHMFKDSVMQKLRRKLMLLLLIFVLCSVVLMMGELVPENIYTSVHTHMTHTTHFSLSQFLRIYLY